MAMLLINGQQVGSEDEAFDSVKELSNEDSPPVIDGENAGDEVDKQAEDKANYGETKCYANSNSNYKNPNTSYCFKSLEFH